MVHRCPAVLAIAALSGCGATSSLTPDDPAGSTDVLVAGLGDRAFVRHDLTVVLRPRAHRIEVIDTIALPPWLDAAGVEFTLCGALDIERSTPAVRRVDTITHEDGWIEARYALTEAPTDGTLTLAYAGTIDFGLGAQKEEYERGMRDTRGIVGTEGVYLDGGSAWTPTFAGAMIRFDLDVTAPETWHVIAQGDGSSSVAPGHAHWGSDQAFEQVYLVGGPLTVERDDAGGVEALVYLHEHDSGLARKYLDATAQYIEMYQDLIGDYPYGKFALVENFWETGYGMPSFTLLGEQVIRLPFILTSSYPHEILHNWWGNSVFVDYASGNWCEGLTAYMADHLIQEQRGAGAEYRRRSLQKYRDFAHSGRDFPLRAFTNRHSAATEAVGYGKSLMLFHMLRRAIGDEAFRAAMKEFYAENRGRAASFEDVRDAVERVTADDFDAFFAQWVERAGAPHLALGPCRVSDGGAFRVTGRIEQVQDGAPFALAVPVTIETSAGAERFTVDLEDRTTDFDFTVGAQPLAVAVDPDFDVFRQLDWRETPVSIGAVFGTESILAVVPKGDVDAWRPLIDAWDTESHRLETVTDAALTELPTDRTLWVLGCRNRWASAIVEGDDVVTLNDAQVPVDDHCIVVVRRAPGPHEQVWGWISLEPAAALEGLARKLPHYGRYSYVAFEGDEPVNTVKGEWDTSDSPLVTDVRAEDERTTALAIEPDERAALADPKPVFSTAALATHVAWLAAPERRGRGLGSTELDDCAQYIVEQFATMGLEPGGDDHGWLQWFEATGPDGSPVRAANVVAILRGANPDFAGQSVVVGAHYDHLGLGWPDVHEGDEGKVHPGADDNASGVAVLLEVARSLAGAGNPPRTCVFVAFSGEEAGRLGSIHYVEHPARPQDGIRAMVNLDTVGRLDDGAIAVHATGTADEWPHIFRGVGFVTGIASTNVPARVGGSDQDSFIDAGIPAVQLFTGAHADYHRPSDTVDKVDVAGLVKVAEFLRESVVYLLERPEPLTVRIEGVESPAPGGGAAGSRRVSFGIVPAFGFAGPGVQVDGVVEGSPAEAAGVQPGDVLLAIDGLELVDLRAFSDRLKELEPGQTVEARLDRGGIPVVVTVELHAR